MSGRNVEFVATIAGKYALSVNRADMPTPPGWEWTPLKEIARLESGHTPSRSHPEYWDGDIPWIGIRDAREHHGGRISETFQRVTQAGIDNSAARILPANTVCLSRTASVGYVVVTDRPMATSQDFVNWICSEAIDPDFLMWLFRAEGEDGLRRFGKGSTHTTIYFPEVEAFHVCIPSRKMQRRIADKLDPIFARSRAAKERLDRLPALLDRLKKSILAAAFRGDLTRDWREAHPDLEPASTLLARLRVKAHPHSHRSTERPVPPAVSAKGFDLLPASWAWTTLGEVLDRIEAGHSPQAEGRPAGAGEYGVLKVSAVSWTEFDPSENKALPPQYEFDAEVSVRAGDLLLSRANTIELVGAVVLVEEDHPRLMLSDKTLRLVPRAGIDKRYLLFVLRSRSVRASFEEDATGTSTSMRNLSQDKIRSARIPVPPLSEQKEVGRILSLAWQRIRGLEEWASKLRKRFDRLDMTALDLAFRGELVPQDPNDEPASVLLDRIRAERAVHESTSGGRRRKQPKPPSGEVAALGPNRLATSAYAPIDPVDLVTAALVERGRLTSADAQAMTGLDAARVRAALRQLVDAGRVRVDGKGRGTAYVWSEK